MGDELLRQRHDGELPERARGRHHAQRKNPLFGRDGFPTAPKATEKPAPAMPIPTKPWPSATVAPSPANDMHNSPPTYNNAPPKAALAAPEAIGQAAENGRQKSPQQVLQSDRGRKRFAAERKLLAERRQKQAESLAHAHRQRNQNRRGANHDGGAGEGFGHSWIGEDAGGAEGSRTPDLSNANAALYQLSYGPAKGAL